VDDLIDRLTTSGSPSATSFVEQFREMIRLYGSRGQNEYDILSATWEVRPRIALTAIDLMRRSDDAQAPATRHAASLAERDAALAEVRSAIAGDAETAGMFEAALGSAQLFLSGRERGKTNTIMVIGEVRMALRELAGRLVERGTFAQIEHLFMLTATELERVKSEPARLGALAADRWQAFRELYDREPVFVVNGVVPTLDQMTRRDAKQVPVAASGTVLTGAAGSGGTATGRARVVLDAADPVGLEPGDVLIAPQTDPSWVPLFIPAVAVVVNVGAMGSHAMIVSRELGIPCAVSVADATHAIPDGAIVTVDGAAGTVTVH
jgi:pyruvate,water dikinase